MFLVGTIRDEEIITENFPKIMENIKQQIQEAQRT